MEENLHRVSRSPDVGTHNQNDSVAEDNRRRRHYNHHTHGVQAKDSADWNAVDDLDFEILNFHSSPSNADDDMDFEIVNFHSSPSSPSPVVTNDEPLRLPIPMSGLGVPNEQLFVTQRSLPELARGPPYFYYENVVLAPWETISRHLYDVAPEFVDSSFICAAARERGYVHNLPISNRYLIQPPPKHTIQEVLPLTKNWWPTWDTRTKLNCIFTVNASSQLTNRIRSALEASRGEPPEEIKRYVIEQCKKWNLIWVGQNKAVPLEVNEIETLMGFPIYHTRGGGGISRAERLKSLSNSFQVDTLAYHLSVLKPLFPDGINVLSLFTGIGGGEMALHRLQIPMKTVVSVEFSQVNKYILRDFWERTNQKGVLIEFEDVQDLTKDIIVELMKQFGGFDIVIGGSPCNNLAGGNRVTPNCLEGEQSLMFYEYCRVLNVVRETAKEMRRS
ncbi:unnamed protein product [Brassica rapa subsp. narinosa]